MSNLNYAPKIWISNLKHLQRRTHKQVTDQELVTKTIVTNFKKQVRYGGEKNLLRDHLQAEENRLKIIHQAYQALFLSNVVSSLAGGGRNSTAYHN